MAYLEEIADSIKNYLVENGHEYEFDGDKGYFIIREEIGKTGITGISFLQLLDDCVLVRCMTSLKVNQKKLGAMAEYLNRVNDCLINGCFVLDYDEGKVSYKGYIGCYNGQITDEQLADSFASCELAYEAFGEGMTQVAEGQIKDIKAMFEG